MVKSKILSIKGVEHSFMDRRGSLSQITSEMLKESYTCQQIHRNKVAVKGDAHFYPGCDGIIAGKNSLICLRTADCLPIFLYSPDKKIIAALHAGWRGLSMLIVAKAFEKFKTLALNWKNVIAAIGPHIGQCCYQVDAKVAEIFASLDKKNTSFVKSNEGILYLDLGGIAFNQLVKIGIPPSNIEDVNVCTSCHSEYFSWRRDKTSCRNLSFIKIT